MGDAGFDLGDGLRRLLDLRFADDIVLFGRTQKEIARLLDSLVEEFAHVGLTLNASKTVVLTTEAQPEEFVETPNGKRIKRVGFHKWLGCILDVDTREQAFEYHMNAAAKAFYANSWILKCRHASLSHRLDFFGKIVTPVACFSAGRQSFKKI